ncbi:MAG: agmatine deiminase family protein [Gemmatimonas sp.]|nr:agmatine deiminase family protein [Gemmatimonas sp.]
MIGVPAPRWPAEWEPHHSTWIGWPHHEPDWPGKLEAVEWVYVEIVRVLHRHERVEILVPDERARDGAAARLIAHDVDLGRCGFHLVPTDRVWLRDSGPTGVYQPDGFEWLRWRFNGWAKYSNHRRDERVGAAIAELTGLPSDVPRRPTGEVLVLEGGGIETNGAGAMLVTEEWLLSDSQLRNPGMGREDYEDAFARYLGVERTIWLGDGIVGDDTHGHVDDLARFTAKNTIALAHERNPFDENHRRTLGNFRRLEREAETFPDGLTIVELPFPRPVLMDGQRLPASYANFYIANGVVLVPTFNDVNDRVALGTLAELFPDREVIGIHSVDLVWGLGTLHCLTQQQPVG